MPGLEVEEALYVFVNPGSLVERGALTWESSKPYNSSIYPEFRVRYCHSAVLVPEVVALRGIVKLPRVTLDESIVL